MLCIVVCIDIPCDVISLEACSLMITKCIQRRSDKMIFLHGYNAVILKFMTKLIHKKIFDK